MTFRDPTPNVKPLFTKEQADGFMKSPHNDPKSYEPELFNYRPGLFRSWIIPLCILGVLAGFVILGILGISKLAYGHIEGHPEWTGTMTQSKNTMGVSCCGMGDAQLLNFDEWENRGGQYRVLLDGQWFPINKNQLTENAPNETSHAIVWRNGTYIYCFRPLDTF